MRCCFRSLLCLATNTIVWPERNTKSWTCFSTFFSSCGLSSSSGTLSTNELDEEEEITRDDTCIASGGTGGTKENKDGATNVGETGDEGAITRDGAKGTGIDEDNDGAINEGMACCNTRADASTAGMRCRFC